jgi:hypothetical protein
MLAKGLQQARTGGLGDGLLYAGAQLGVGRAAADGFDDRRSLAGVAGNQREEEVDGHGQTREGDGAEQDAAEPSVGAAPEAGQERGEGFGSASVGKGEGGFGGEVVAFFEGGGNQSDGAGAFDGEQSGVDGAEDFRLGLVSNCGAEQGAQTQDQRGAQAAYLADGAGGFDADGLVGVGERVEKNCQQIGVVEAGAIDEGVGACAAQGSGGVVWRTPACFHLVMAQTAQVGVFLAVFELDEGLDQRVLGPALRIGFFRVEEEAVVGCEDVREQSEEFGVGDECRGLGDDEVVAMGERFAEVLCTDLVQDDSTSERSDQSFQLGEFLIEAARSGFAGLLCAHALLRLSYSTCGAAKGSFSACQRFDCIIWQLLTDECGRGRPHDSRSGD